MKIFPKDRYVNNKKIYLNVCYSIAFRCTVVFFSVTITILSKIIITLMSLTDSTTKNSLFYVTLQVLSRDGKTMLSCDPAASLPYKLIHFGYRKMF